MKCGRLLHTGEGRIVVAFTAGELAELASVTLDPAVRARLLCALSLVDATKAGEIA